MELLWERYRSMILVVVAAAFGALLIHYGVRYFNQRATDAKWSAFAATIDLKKIYEDPANANNSLAEELQGVEMSSLEQAFASADGQVKPFLLLAIARKAMLDQQWDRAEKALADLESGYPKHSLVKQSSMPVQSREPAKEDDDTAARNPRRKQEWEPAKAGSIVGLMREQIASARQFAVPARFRKPEVPADAPRVKFTFGDYGDVVIALMPQAPLHRDAILELARQNYWTGIAVDEIQRPAQGVELPRALHFGFQSTKVDDRTEWTTTEPSEEKVEFEETGLSHFPGAVAARNEADGGSCANRLWINVDDWAQQDGSTVVVGFVVEGLDVLESITDATMSAQEEERGRGRPDENIRVTAVEVVE